MPSFARNQVLRVTAAGPRRRYGCGETGRRARPPGEPMKLTAGVLFALRALAGGIEDPDRTQDWFGAPKVPDIFRSDDPPPDAFRLGDVPPRPSPAPAQDPPSSVPAWGQGLGAPDLQAWQHEDDLRFIREWAGDALLGLPLLAPQLILESVLPRGLR